MNKKILIALLFIVFVAPIYGRTAGEFSCIEDNETIIITKYNGSVKDVIIPETINGLHVVGIGYVAFESNQLTSVDIPNSVTSIEGYAFQGCTGLTSLTIPNNVISIGGSAFSGCTSLTSVTFQSTLQSFSSYYAFIGDLRAKYLAGGTGTYTRFANGQVWRKQ
jgi:hypothetical protein